MNGAKNINNRSGAKGASGLKRVLIFVSLFCLLLNGAPPVRSARAIEIIEFDQKYFVERVRAGDRIAIWFHAPWCPTCKIQEQALQVLEEDDIDIQIMRVDFDESHKLRETLRVPTQSMWILFDNGKEVTRVIGAVRIEQIREILKKKV